MTQETQYATAMLSLAREEHRLDPTGKPIPMYGVQYPDNVMKGTAHLAEIGGVVWKDKSPQARKVATDLGYTSTSNCMAMFRECIADGLVHADAVTGRLTCTVKGLRAVEEWEDELDGW